MTRSEYVEQVLSVMKYVTAKEREAIRTELDAHIEDHICGLLELDYPEDLAEERTMALMGDPEEVGRELDRHYKPTLWDTLWDNLEGIATILLCVMGLQALLGVGILFHARDYVVARFAPKEFISEELKVEYSEACDYRTIVGNDVLKVYEIRIGEREISNRLTGEREEMRVAELSVCAYDRIPFGIVSGELMRRLVLEDQRGPLPEGLRTGGERGGSWGAVYACRAIPIRPGDTYVTLSYDRYGESVELKIPLPEVMP